MFDKINTTKALNKDDRDSIKVKKINLFLQWSPYRNVKKVLPQVKNWQG